MSVSCLFPSTAEVYEMQCGRNTKFFVPRTVELRHGENYTRTRIACNREGGEVIRPGFNASCLHSFISRLGRDFSVHAPFRVWTSNCSRDTCVASDGKSIAQHTGLHAVCAMYSE